MPQDHRARRWLIALILTFAGAPLAAQPAVTGTAFLPSRQPLSEARIDLVPVLSNFEAGRLRLAGQEPLPVASGTSDAAGRFLLRAPAPGVFKIVVRRQGRLPMQSAPLVLAADEELPPLTLTAADTARFVVQGTGGRPLSGAWIFATGSEEKQGRVQVTEGWRPDFRIGRTGADGSITLPRRPQERLDVSVFLPSGAEHRQLALEGGTITVSTAAGASHLLRIVSAKNQPLEGVLVRSGDLAWPVGLTDAEGRLTIPPSSGKKIRLVTRDGQQQEVDLQAGSAAETVVILKEPAFVAGRVTGQSTAQPLAGALVSPGTDPGAFQQTDAQGRYRLVSPDPDGFPLQARAALHLPKSVRVTGAHLRSGRAPALHLTRATALRGQVVDPQGTPLPGAALLAVPERQGGFEGAPVETATGRGTTDRTGRFELGSLRSGGFYEIRASHPGYLPGSAKAMAPGSGRDAAALKIVLTPARAARGRVQDKAGRPLTGVDVRLSPAPPAGAQHRVEKAAAPAEEDPFAARTDAQGRFLIARAPAERVDLTARQPGYATGHLRGIRIPSGTGPAEMGILVLEPGVRLQGRVLDRAGKALSGAEVHLVETVDNLERQNGRLRDEPADAVTAVDGTFTLQDQPRGTPLHLLVRAAGHLPAGVRGVLAPLSHPLTIRLEPAARLGGRIVGPQGEPVAGARIDLTWQASAPERPERKSGPPIVRSDLSGNDGRFEIPDAPAGEVTLAVTAQGYVPVEGVEVTVPWRDPERELTIPLDKGAVLTGRITTTAGQPVSGARVATEEGASGVSDDEGSYSVEGVALGKTTVVVAHSDYRRAHREVVIASGINTLDLTFEEGVEVTGRVVDGQGSPILGARVTLSPLLREGMEYSEPTGEDGSFRLSPVAQGRYRLQAQGDGYSPAVLKRPVVVAAEPLDGLEIVLERGGAITGRVLGLDAGDLAQVEVTANDERGDTLPATVDADGGYEVRHLPPGTYLVRAELASGQRHAQARVPLPANGEVTRDLEFAPRLTLSGQVLYDEEPLSEAKISLRGSRLAVERTVRTDYQGGFRFEGLEPDTYWLGLSHSREILVHNETLELTSDLDHVIRLRPATVSGTVIDARNGRPVAGTLIVLRHVEGAEFVITDSAQPDGTFSLHRVPAGGYRLTATAPGHSPAEQTLAIAGQDLAGLEIALPPTPGLELTVRLASGRVPDQVHLRVLGPGGALVLGGTHLPGRTGEVALSTVPEGSWTLVVGAPGAATAVVPVTVPGEPVAVTLPNAGNLRLRVPALEPSDLRATATLLLNGQPFWALSTGGNVQDRWPLVGGKAVIAGAPAGVWQIRVDAPDGRSWTGVATTSGQGEAEAALE